MDWFLLKNVSNTEKKQLHKRQEIGINTILVSKFVRFYFFQSVQHYLSVFDSEVPCFEGKLLFKCL